MEQRSKCCVVFLFIGQRHQFQHVSHRLDFLTTIHYSHNPVVCVRDCLSAILPLPLATPPPTLPPITAPPKGVGMSLSLTQKVFYGLEFFLLLLLDSAMNTSTSIAETISVTHLTLHGPLI